jgi:hypothetical protein
MDTGIFHQMWNKFAYIRYLIDTLSVMYVLGTSNAFWCYAYWIFGTISQLILRTAMNLHELPYRIPCIIENWDALLLFAFNLLALLVNLVLHIVQSKTCFWFHVFSFLFQVSSRNMPWNNLSSPKVCFPFVISYSVARNLISKLNNSNLNVVIYVGI